MRCSKSVRFTSAGVPLPARRPVSNKYTPQRLLHKLFDENDRDALVAERGHNVENAVDDDRGASARGLIEDE